MTPDLISVGTGGVTSGPLIDAIEKDDESAINSEIEKIKAEKKKAEEEARKKAEEEAKKKAEEEAKKQAEEEEKQKVE
jgi:colicin import membrane protein